MVQGAQGGAGGSCGDPGRGMDKGLWALGVGVHRPGLLVGGWGAFLTHVHVDKAGQSRPHRQRPVPTVVFPCIPRHSPGAAAGASNQGEFSRCPHLQEHEECLSLQLFTSRVHSQFSQEFTSLCFLPVRDWVLTDLANRCGAGSKAPGHPRAQCVHS